MTPERELHLVMGAVERPRRCHHVLSRRQIGRRGYSARVSTRN
jgi:hypothetical protein